MEQVLNRDQTTGAEFRVKGQFLVSLHGTFTGDAFVYCIPDEHFIAEADRVPADWVKAHTRPLTATDPTVEIAGGEGYIYQIRAANAGALGVWTHSRRMDTG